MDHFASPFWVNLLILAPLILWLYLRKNKTQIEVQQLLWVAVFGIAFGLIESSVVVYLRAATGLLPGFMGTLTDVQKQATEVLYNQQILAAKLPLSLLTVEVIREAGTIVMLFAIAFIGAKHLKERIALFIWAFALWDFFYYVFLYLLVGWPRSIFTKDVLFLIPEPWLGEVWLPMIIDTLVVLVIFFNRTSSKKSKE